MANTDVRLTINASPPRLTSSTAICKLFGIFEIDEDKWYSEGSGILVSPDTVITVAHNVFTREDGFTPEIHVHVGFRGDGHVKHEVQAAEYVVLHWEYYKTGDRTYDLAVIRVAKPFKSVDNFISYKDCPEILNLGL